MVQTMMKHNFAVKKGPTTSLHDTISNDEIGVDSPWLISHSTFPMDVIDGYSSNVNIQHLVRVRYTI